MKTRDKTVGGRTQALDLSQCLRQDARAVGEKTGILGTRDGIVTRLLALRMPEALVSERRRQAYAVAKKRGDTPAPRHLTLLAWTLFIPNGPATVWPPQTVGVVYSFRWQIALVFKAWKRGLHLATVTTSTRHSPLCYLYGRMLLILFASALSSPLRATLWQQQRERSLFKLVRHFQAGADQWFPALFRTAGQLAQFLVRACVTAERLVTKELRKRPTRAQLLRTSLGAPIDFFEPALALAA